MTPTINKIVVNSRPLWDPEPKTFVFREALQMTFGDLNLKRVQLSDFAVIAFKMAVKTNMATRTEVDMFETVFTRGCHVRKIRDHKGYPASAPDGSTMVLDGEPYPGSSAVVKGPRTWRVSNVHECPGYEAWIEELLQSRLQLAEGELKNMNHPFPIPIDLIYANIQKCDIRGHWFHGDGTFLDKSMTLDKQNAHYKAFYNKSVNDPAAKLNSNTNISECRPVVDLVNNAGRNKDVSRSKPSLDSDPKRYDKLLKESLNLRKRNRDLVGSEEHLLRSMHVALRDQIRQFHMDQREVEEWSRLIEDKRRAIECRNASLYDDERIMVDDE